MVLAAVLLLEILGTPFSYRQFRGGFEVDWVGDWVDEKHFETGLSEARATWLKTWTLDKLATGTTLVK